MRRLETRPITHFNEAVVDQPTVFDVQLPDDRVLDYDMLVGNTPALTSEYDGYDNPQLVLGTDTVLPLWDEAASFPVGRLDDVHGRTLEVLAKDVHIEDRYGFSYGSLCIKGSNLSDPHFFTTLTAARKYIIYGLQESLVMERVLRASQFLRENKARTEYICGLVLPENFPVRDPSQENLDVLESTQELPAFLEKLAGRFALEQYDKEKGQPSARSVLEIKAEMIDRFKDCDYMVSYRAMDCPYRLKELANPDKYRALRDFIHRTDTSGKLTTYIKDYNSIEYIGTVFAFNAAKNTARMHKAGVKHGFLVPLNVTAMGSIVDLDSCAGESLGLGDKPITEKDEIVDMVRCMAGMNETIFDAKIEEKSNNEHFRKLTANHNAGTTFLKYYLNERFDTQGERVARLASILVNYEVDEELAEDGVFLLHLAEQACSIFINELEVNECPTDLPIYDSVIKPQVERHKTFLRHLPAKLFQDLSKVDNNLMSDSWTLNHLYENIAEELEEPERPIHHPLRVLVNNLVVGELVKSYEDGIITNPEDLLFLLCHAGNTMTASSSEQQIAIDQASQYIDRLTEAVIKQMGQDSPEAIAGRSAVVLKKLQEFKHQMGTITFGGRPHNVLYLQDDEQYQRVFTALGITIADNIPLATWESRERIQNLLGQNTLIIADYELLEWTAVADTSETLGSKFFIQHARTKPMIFIPDISADTPTLTINGLGPKFEGQTELASWQALELLMPSLEKSTDTRLIAMKDGPADTYPRLLDSRGL